jgi:DNA polymerase
MSYLFPDLETFSELDIKRVSLDRYAKHPSTRILMCAFAFDDGPVELWQEGDSAASLEALKRDMRTHTNVPWNAGFERNLTRRVWKLYPLKWRDAMVDALYAGLPAGLKDCNRVPYFANEAETSKETLLINKFCKPQKDGSVRNRHTDPEDWDAFCAYCKADVNDTRLIFQWLLKRFELPEREYRAWLIDQDINERGLPMDRLLTYRAWEEAQRLQIRENRRLVELTGLDNPNSTAQLLPWLKARGYPYTSLSKELVKKALSEDPDAEVIDVDD